VLLSGAAIDRQPSFDLPGFVNAFTDLASRYDLNCQNALRSYLQKKDLPFEEEGSVISGKLETGEEVRLQFNASGGIVLLNNGSFSV